VLVWHDQLGQMLKSKLKTHLTTD